jgi:F-type H+-transporting ATPase subunit epsilon
MPENPTVELVVITPERQVLSERTSFVAIPAHDGELGVLPMRAPLMCQLGVGELRYGQGGLARRVFIDGGFAQVLADRVTVLAPEALPAEEITAATITAAQSAADKPDLSGEDRQRAARKVSVLRRLQSRE